MAPIDAKTKSSSVRWDNNSQRDETMKDKMLRKARENPFVPLGCVLTVGALSYGLFSFIKGNAKVQQKMMRARVLAQGSTVLAVIAGLGYEIYLDSKKKKIKD
ncbi:HIG1 domain family member 2A, mitochondrial [Exaiptasia diaphana]|uniref:HIG1 domain-containing protein n=1 Tax=Exaiptasia diaphana TaxID=2652724 RepID=A0A913X7W8_EXADI|nr:HIG1 domain family member 2A, mitochondrial [Exaiptasia diaphana]